MDENPALARLARHIDPQATLLRAWPLAGGVSARVTAFEIGLPGGETRTLVLRRHGALDLAQNPDVAAHEYRLLQRLQEAGLAAPVPVHLEQSSEILPAPALVVEFVDGETIGSDELDDHHLQQMAAYLARLHTIDGTRSGLTFLRRMERSVAARLGNPPGQLDEALHEERIRHTLAAAWPVPARNAPALLHGDFWPGNILWKEGRLAAVVDWEDAATGDPLADLTNARLELLWACGARAMQRFTEHYLSLTRLDTAGLPYWDLYAALRPLAGMHGWGLAEETLRTLRVRHRWFTAQAFAAMTRANG